MAGIPCPNGDGGMCYPPSTALVIFRGTYSFVSEALLERILPVDRLLPRDPHITTFEGGLPPNVVRAATLLDSQFGGALAEYEKLHVGKLETRLAAEPSDGVLFTCTCGHGPFKVGL